jgi:DNA mismatch repair protein MutS2
MEDKVRNVMTTMETPNPALDITAQPTHSGDSAPSEASADPALASAGLEPASTESAESELTGDEQDRSLRVLEWPQVQARVLACCQWIGGQEILSDFAPLDDLDELHRRQLLVAEGVRLEGEGNGRSLGGLVDPRPALEAAMKGRVLTPEQLLDVELMCAISREVHSQFRNRQPDLPLLYDIMHPVVPHSRLEQRLHRSLTRDAKVSDEASQALRKLRADVRELEEKLHRSLQGLLRHPELSKTYQEPIITQRDGRFVIPVKAEYKGRFPGLVIDQSSSGATLFMEPFVAVSLGNELRQKQLAEQREVHRILVELSGLVAEHGPALLRAAASLARLDAYTALARYLFKIEGTIPKVTENGDLLLRRAHHPLIGEGSVPIDLELVSGTRTLVITGPNTGGKTVALKIVGLLSLMASSGFPVPASELSTFPLISKVWADIGDEQSLAQSLSTFSAHLVHILQILRHADHRSLVLLDELGAGTDPSEGGALGVAILNELHRRGCRTVVTTHLSQLKVQAKKMDGFENAAVEFDTSTLRPTYRVLMGIPGRSNALAIAAGLGLPESLLREARSFLGGGYQNIEQLLDDLELERDAARQREARLEEERARLEETRRRLEAERDELAERKDREIEQARLEGERILEETKAKTRFLFKEFQQGMKAVGEERKEALLQARRLAREWAERMRGGAVSEDSVERYGSTEVREEDIAFDHLGDQARAVARQAEAELEAQRKALAIERRAQRKKQKAAQTRNAPQAGPPSKFAPGPQQLPPGTRVHCPKLGQEGEVVSQRGHRVDVRLGALKMTFNRDELEVFKNQNLPREAPEPVTVKEYTPSSGADTIEMRLNIRGQRVDTALFELDQYLDRAVRAGLDKVEILHGKGTGTLRQAVQQHLKAHRQVADFRDGGHGEGSWGVTIVSLRV